MKLKSYNIIRKLHQHNGSNDKPECIPTINQIHDDKEHSRDKTPSASVIPQNSKLR